MVETLTPQQVADQIATTLLEALEGLVVAEMVTQLEEVAELAELAVMVKALVVHVALVVQVLVAKVTMAVAVKLKDLET
jgi:hypothetical protein